MAAIAIEHMAHGDYVRVVIAASSTFHAGLAPPDDPLSDYGTYEMVVLATAGIATYALPMKTQTVYATPWPTVPRRATSRAGGPWPAKSAAAGRCKH